MLSTELEFCLNRKSTDRTASDDEVERAESRKLSDDLIAAAQAERPNGMKLRGLLAGHACGGAAKLESQALGQVRDAAIGRDLWILE